MFIHSIDDVGMWEWVYMIKVALCMMKLKTIPKYVKYKILLLRNGKQKTLNIAMVMAAFQTLPTAPDGR